MAKKWEGNIFNRLEEGNTFCDEIKVGTGVTEYFYSDRKAYEVIEVKDQKHITVREYDHIHVGDGSFDNNWQLVSNEDNACRNLERRGNTWYWVSTITAKDIECIDENPDLKVEICVAGYDLGRIREKGKQTKRYKANVSIGVARYYYDYEF